MLKFKESLLFKVEFSPFPPEDKVDLICSFSYCMKSDDRYPLREMGIFSTSKEYEFFFDPDENLYVKITFEHVETEEEIEQALQEERDWNGFSDPEIQDIDLEGDDLDLWIEAKENKMRKRIAKSRRVLYSLKHNYICCLYDFDDAQASFRYIENMHDIDLKPIQLNDTEGESGNISYL
jgi:hypothetical protein